MINIFGSIGYTHFINITNNKNLLLFADKHDDIPSCENKINIAEWLESKFKKSIILLEEVPRLDNELLALWDESIHTKELKELYLNNKSTVIPIDIRHQIIPFSWEVIVDKKDILYNISLNKYLLLIDECLSMKNPYLKQHCKLYNHKLLINTPLGEHFLSIKDNFKEFINKIKKLNILYELIPIIYKKYQYILEEINEIISSIMEWYICACICVYNNKQLIIHIGLAHSEQIVKLLNTKYNYKLVEQQGINKLNDIESTNLSGCVKITKTLNNQFGGFFNKL